VGNAPSGVAVTPSGDRVYVANSFSGDVSVINASVNTVVATVSVGGQLGAMGQFIVPAAPPRAQAQNEIPALSNAMLFTLGLALVAAAALALGESLRR
jgi:YVTN family beta-propeller protein